MSFNSAFLEQLRAVRSAPPPSAAPARPLAAEVVQIVDNLTPSLAPLHTVATPPSVPPVAEVVARRHNPKPPPRSPVSKGVQTVDTPQPKQTQPLSLAGLPLPLADLVRAAERGELPSGPVKLGGGFVMDLGGYVIDWAKCWPGDEAHILRRLADVLSALGRA